jgi:NADH-quinone oxidoreductase subunit G
MPCTAKKYEAKLPKFAKDGRPDVDHVLTTQELARMIQEAGLRFEQLEPRSLDMPMGFKTGAGVIFGTTGGVTEAVLRCAVEKVQGVKLDCVEFEEVRGQKGRREATVSVADTKLRLAIIHGLANARELAEQVRAGECRYDLIEVMACPGGCVGGAGQPVTKDIEVRSQRAKGLYEADRMLQLHKSQDNHLLAECYQRELGEIGGRTAHELLHTEYQSRRRICGQTLVFQDDNRPSKLGISVCVGTSCFVRGSQALLERLIRRIQTDAIQDRVDVEATFCFESCDRGPSVRIGNEVIHHCDLDKAWKAIQEQLAGAFTTSQGNPKHEI